MNVYISVSTNNPELSNGVEAGILSQTIQCGEPVICDTEGEYNSHRKYTPLRCKGEAASREKIRQAAIASGDEFCFMMDKDIVCNIPTVFEQLLTEINTDEKIGFVGCKPNPDHIDIGCGIWRVAAMPEFKPADETCMCGDVCKTVIDNGHTVKFLSIPNGITEV